MTVHDICQAYHLLQKQYSEHRRTCERGLGRCMVGEELARGQYTPGQGGAAGVRHASSGAPW